jgi:ubiquinone/menaquinone biosynthesis C-methylase UbiE
MRTNRVVSRKEAAKLPLRERIHLESAVTDAEEQERAKLRPLQSFEQYRESLPWRAHLFDFLGSVFGKTILDLGCGYNPTSVYFALAGARKVYAGDVSLKAVKHIRSVARRQGVADRVSAVVMAGEQLPFPDESFDIVHGEAVLHHLETPLAGPEIARVLRKGGKAGFKDPFGHNLLFELVRDHFPYPWKPKVKGTDRPLKLKDIRDFGSAFSSWSYRGFGLLSPLATLIVGRGDSELFRLLHKFGALVIMLWPYLERYCRFVVTCVRK